MVPRTAQCVGTGCHHVPKPSTDFLNVALPLGVRVVPFLSIQTTARGELGFHRSRILAGIVIAIGAIAVAFSSANRTDSSEPRPLIRAAIAPLPDSSVPTPSTLTTEGAKSPRLPPGRVWECTGNGQRTFSDSPCADRSTVRQLSEVNRMDATPVPPPATYSRSDSGYAPDYANQSAAQSIDDSSVCEGLRDEVNEIHERMRHLYTNPEGNYYRGRLHKIGDRQYELHCLR
jgi:hypothetical protein